MGLYPLTPYRDNNTIRERAAESDREWEWREGDREVGRLMQSEGEKVSKGDRE